jgi:hypothetical protein
MYLTLRIVVNVTGQELFATYAFDQEESQLQGVDVLKLIGTFGQSTY